MTNSTYKKTLEDLEELKIELSNCPKHPTVYALDFAFESQKDLAKHKISKEQANIIEKKLYGALASYGKNCSCKKIKR